jgi:hypothetical protein
VANVQLEISIPNAEPGTVATFQLLPLDFPGSATTSAPNFRMARDSSYKPRTTSSFRQLPEEQV